MCENPGCVTHIKYTGSIRRPHLCRVSMRGLPSTPSRGPQIIASQVNHHRNILIHLYLIKILRSHLDPISLSFPVNPRHDSSTPVNRHNKSPIDTTRALRLAGQTVVLMSVNLFERLAVSLKLVSMLFHYSPPPTSLVFTVGSENRDRGGIQSNSEPTSTPSPLLKINTNYVGFSGLSNL